MYGSSESRIAGWIFVIIGVIAAWKPARTFMALMSMHRAVPFVLRVRGSLHMITPGGKIRLLIGLVLVIAGIVTVVRNRDRLEFWQTNSRLKAGSAAKKVSRLDDPALLLTISNRAQLPEIKNAAQLRRAQLLRQMLETGSDPGAIRKEVDTVTMFGMYDPAGTEFLALAAQKYPEIVKEFWPRLQAWAHADSKSHADKPGGFHTDRTDYYDYIRYSNGRTVANKNGRKRHTDTRGSYSDCHEDRHQDSTTHSDRPNADKIARFKPWTGNS